MSSSFKIFAVRGIDIRIHFTFPLILAWAAFQYSAVSGDALTGAVFGVIIVSLLFVLVTLHELGHSFAALHYGVPVRRIVLLPIGGMAQLERMPEKPIQEFVIAIAGPAVNVVLAVVFGVIALAAGISITNPLQSISLSFTSIFSYLFVYNLLLAFFNLLPAFPMDGGRILRSLLAMAMDYVRATTIAVNVGRVVAVLLGIYGFFNGAIFTIFIAFFIFTSATQELALVRWRGEARRSISGYLVQQAYSPAVGVLGPNDNLRRALGEHMRGWQANFPVVQNGRYIGFITEANLLRAANLAGPDALVYAAIAPEIKPVTLSTDLAEALQRMKTFRVNALPVVDDGRFLGMITYQQIQNFLSQLSGSPPFSPVQSASQT